MRRWFGQQFKKGHRYTLHVIIDPRCDPDAARASAENLRGLVRKGVNVIFDSFNAMGQVGLGIVGGRMHVLFVPSMTREEVLEVTKREADAGNEIAKKKLVEQADGTLDFTEAAVAELQERGTRGQDVKRWLKNSPPGVDTVSTSPETHALHTRLVKQFLAADAAAKAKGEIVRVEDAQVAFETIGEIVENITEAARMLKGIDGEGRASKAQRRDLVINEAEETIMYSSVAQARKAVVYWEAAERRRREEEERRRREEEERRRREEEERRRREEEERRRWLPCRC